MIWYLSLMQLTAHFDIESLPEADSDVSLDKLGDSEKVPEADSGAGLDESDSNEKVIIVYCD